MKNPQSQVQADNQEVTANSAALLKNQAVAKPSAKVSAKAATKAAAKDVLLNKKKHDSEQEQALTQDALPAESQALAAQEPSASSAPAAIQAADTKANDVLIAQTTTDVVSDAGSGLTMASNAGTSATPDTTQALASVSSASDAVMSDVSAALKDWPTYVTPMNAALGVGGVVALHQLTHHSSSTAIAPVFKSLAVTAGAAGAGRIVLNYDLDLDPAHPPAASAFAVSINGVANPVDAVLVSGKTVTLTLHNAVGTGSLSVAVNYTDPTTGNDTNAVQDASGNDAASVSIVSGVVADGYIKGASVYIDTNNNGSVDTTDYLVGTTDADGRFFIPKSAPTGKLLVTGGVNTDTGVPNNLTLKAPAPDLSKPVAVNPLTTLVTSLMSSTVTAEQASAKVATAFGLTLPAGSSLLSIDPISAANDSSNAAFGLAAQKVAAQIATIVTLASTDPSATTGAASKVFDNLGAKVSSAQTVNLADTTTLSAVLNGAVSSTAVSTLTSSLASALTVIQSATSVDNISTAQSQVLDKIAPAAPTGISVTAALTNDTTPEVKVSLNITALDGTAAANSDTVELYEGSNLLAAIPLTAADIAKGYALISPDATHALTQGSHDLSAKIKDNAGNSSTASATAKVAVDSEAPAFTSESTAASNENVAAGTVVYTATSTDTGATYSLKATGDASAFSINASTGAVSLVGSLDYEANSSHSYSFTVIATDALGNASEKAVTLAVNNLDEVAPTITSAATATAVNENEAAGTVVYTATSTDTGDTATGATVYSLKATGDAAAFSINASTGAVSLRGSPNYEAKDSYSFTVVATDAAGNASEKPVTLAINNVNEAPAISSAATATVAENGTGAYTTVAADPDAGTKLTYTIAGTDAALFNINADTGVVTFKNAPDFEAPADAGANNVYDITVTASDDGALSATQAVAISVTNVNEAPTVANHIAAKVFVAGGSSNTYQVPANSFADVDAGTTFTYSAKLADGSALPAWLKFDASTRTFSEDKTVSVSMPAGALTVRVTASDGALTAYDDFVLTSVTAPVVQSFSVTDSTTDNGATLGKSGEALSFVVTLSEAVTTTGTLTAVFNVNGQDVTATSAAVAGASTITFTGASVPATGGDGTSISLTSLVSTSAITGDVSHQALVALTAGAVTYAGYTVDNTAPTVTSSTINMPENSTAGVALTATDVGAVTWALGTGNDTALFGLSNGSLSLQAAKNYEEDPHAYTVNVVATDAAGNVKNQAVTVNLTNVNEAPSISSGNAATFAENGTGTVYTTVGTDPDASTTLTYTIAGPDAALFDISNTGVVTFRAVPNFEAPADVGANNVYDITVNTSDGALSASQAVAITVTNVNEAPLLVTAIPDQAFLIGGAVDTYSVPSNAFVDPENAALTYTATLADGAALPSWLTFDSGTRTFSGNPTAQGQIAVKVTASDGTFSTSDTFDLSSASAPVLSTNLGGVTNLDVRSSIVLSVGETVTAKAGGTITLTDLGGAGYQGESTTHTQTLAVDGPYVHIVGTGANTKIIIDPQFDLDLSSNYSLAVSTGAFHGQTSGQDSAAFTTVNFSTVTPTTFATAAQAQEMVASTGLMQNSLKWFDLSNVGSPASKVQTTLVLDSADYAAVVKGTDLTLTNCEFLGAGYSKLQNFGINDLLYIDNQDWTNTSAQSSLNGAIFEAGTGTSVSPLKMSVGGTDTENGGNYITEIVLDSPILALLPSDISGDSTLPHVISTNWSLTGMVIAA